MRFLLRVSCISTRYETLPTRRITWYGPLRSHYCNDQTPTPLWEYQEARRQLSRTEAQQARSQLKLVLGGIAKWVVGILEHKILWYHGIIEFITNKPQLLKWGTNGNTNKNTNKQTNTKAHKTSVVAQSQTFRFSAKNISSLTSSGFRSRLIRFLISFVRLVSASCALRCFPGCALEEAKSLTL